MKLENTKCEHRSMMIWQITVKLMGYVRAFGAIPVLAHPVASTYWQSDDEGTVRAKKELPAKVHRDLCLDDLRETKG